MSEKKWSELIKQYHTGELTLPVQEVPTLDLNLMPHNIWLQYKTITVGVGEEKRHLI